MKHKAHVTHVVMHTGSGAVFSGLMVAVEEEMEYLVSANCTGEEARLLDCPHRLQTLRADNNQTCAIPTAVCRYNGETQAYRRAV